MFSKQIERHLLTRIYTVFKNSIVISRRIYVKIRLGFSVKMLFIFWPDRVSSATPD